MDQPVARAACRKKPTNIELETDICTCSDDATLKLKINLHSSEKRSLPSGPFPFIVLRRGLSSNTLHAGKSKRLVELDFFRGLVLLIIVVDHISGSMVSRFTLHSFALNDAAEVFIFLGGFATATAYLSMSSRRSESAARVRFIKRAFEIYRAFLITAALMLAASVLLRPLFGHAPNLALHDLDSLIAQPVASVAQILAFERQPYLAAVLPMSCMRSSHCPCRSRAASRGCCWV